jgi:hypothetical protein
MSESWQHLRNSYASERLVVIRRLAGSEDVRRIISESPLWAKRSVYVRPEDGVTWLSQDVPKDSFLSGFFHSDRILHIVRTVSGITLPLVRTESWTNLYRTGEYISRHRDAAGSIQLLLALISPEIDCGGAFVARIQGCLREFILEPGDAVLFEATAVEHFTTPLRPSESTPDPTRVNAVMRLYFA